MFVGADIAVPCLEGKRRYVDLDAAATTPALAAVAEAVDAFMPWYSSAERGAGYKSRVSTAALEGARDAVREFVDAREGDVVVFVRNTTEALNLVSNALPPGSGVLTSPCEHHANMLPWRRHEVRLLPFTASPEELLEATDQALGGAAGAVSIVCATGASNVTGEVWPVALWPSKLTRQGLRSPSTRPSWRRTGRSACARSTSTCWCSRGTRCMRPTARVRSSAAPSC